MQCSNFVHARKITGCKCRKTTGSHLHGIRFSLPSKKRGPATVRHYITLPLSVQQCGVNHMNAAVFPHTMLCCIVGTASHTRQRSSHQLADTTFPRALAGTGYSCSRLAPNSTCILMAALAWLLSIAAQGAHHQLLLPLQKEVITTAAPGATTAPCCPCNCSRASCYESGGRGAPRSAQVPPPQANWAPGQPPPQPELAQGLGKPARRETGLACPASRQRAAGR